MSENRKEFWLRMGPWIFQLLFLPLIVYAVNVTRERDISAIIARIETSVAAEYLRRTEFTQWVEAHSNWGEEVIKRQEGDIQRLQKLTEENGRLLLELLRKRDGTGAD